MRAIVMAGMLVATGAMAQAPPPLAPRVPGASPQAAPDAAPKSDVRVTAEADAPAASTAPASNTAGVAGDAVATVPGEGRAYARRQMACDEVRLAWTIGTGTENQIVVKNEAGTTGVRFIVDRKSGRTLGIQTWKRLGGLTVTSVAANARVDWINCQDADPVHGIAVEWVDASTLAD